MHYVKEGNRDIVQVITMIQYSYTHAKEKRK